MLITSNVTAMAVSFKLNSAYFRLCHHLLLLHLLLCLIMPVYHLSIFLIPLMNFFLWFPLFYVGLVLNVLAKSNDHLDCNSVMWFEPVPVNVSFAPVHMSQCVNVGKSVFLSFMCVFFSQTHVDQFKQCSFFKCF